MWFADNLIFPYELRVIQQKLRNTMDMNGEIEKATARNNDLLQNLRQEANRTLPLNMYDMLREIGAREELKRMTRRQQADESIAAAIAATPENGRLSDAQVKALNFERGLKVDGGGIQNGQIMEAGFNPKTGGYGFVFASVDPNGNVSYRPQEIPRTEIYGMMSGRPEWFGADRIRNVGMAIQESDPSFTDDRLKALGTMYSDRRSALQDKIMNAQANLSGRSGGFGSSFGQRVKLEEMKRDRQFGLQQMKNDGRSNDGQLKELMVIKDFVDNNQDKMDENTRTQLMGAYQNGIMQIAGKYAQKPESSGDGGPSVGNDGTLRLPNGKTIRKDQEYTNPQDGKKYIWRGGDARNWEEIDDKGRTGPQVRQLVDKRNLKTTNAERSARLASQAHFCGRFIPESEVERENSLGNQGNEDVMPLNQPKTAANENVDLDALIAELETPTPSTQDKNAVVSEVNENKDDEIVVEFPEDQEDEKAWGKWFIENGRSGMDKELAREQFFKRRKEEREKREERNRIIGTGPAPEDLNLPRIH